MRRSTFTSFVVLSALLVVALVSCRSAEPWETDDPQQALETFITALYFSRGELAWHFLPPDVQQELESRAATINEGAGTTVVEPHELVGATGFVGPHQIARYVPQEESSADRATFVIETHKGATHTVEMTRVDGVWRIEGLELPPVADARRPVPIQQTPPAGTQGDADEPSAPDVDSPTDNNGETAPDDTDGNDTKEPARLPDEGAAQPAAPTENP